MIRPSPWPELDRLARFVRASNSLTDTLAVEIVHRVDGACPDPMVADSLALHDDARVQNREVRGGGRGDGPVVGRCRLADARGPDGAADRRKPRRPLAAGAPPARRHPRDGVAGASCGRRRRLRSGGPGPARRRRHAGRLVRGDDPRGGVRRRPAPRPPASAAYIVVSLLDAAVTLSAGVGYALATLRGRVRLNRVTWFVSGLTAWVAFAGQLTQGVLLAAVLTGAVAVVPTLIAAPSFANRDAYWQITRLDHGCLVLAVAAIVVLILSSGDLAIAMGMAARGLGAVPAVVKPWRAPRPEQTTVYAAGVLERCARWRRSSPGPSGRPGSPSTSWCSAAP